MPFKSKKQMRKFYALEERGEMKKGTARRWAHETPSIKSLPLYAAKKRGSKKMAAAGRRRKR